MSLEPLKLNAFNNHCELVTYLLGPIKLHQHLLQPNENTNKYFIVYLRSSQFIQTHFNIDNN